MNPAHLSTGCVICDGVRAIVLTDMMIDKSQRLLFLNPQTTGRMQSRVGVVVYSSNEKFVAGESVIVPMESHLAQCIYRHVADSVTEFLLNIRAIMRKDLDDSLASTKH